MCLSFYSVLIFFKFFFVVAEFPDPAGSVRPADQVIYFTNNPGIVTVSFDDALSRILLASFPKFSAVMNTLILVM